MEREQGCSALISTTSRDSSNLITTDDDVSSSNLKSSSNLITTDDDAPSLNLESSKFDHRYWETQAEAQDLVWRQRLLIDHAFQRLRTKIFQC